MNIQPVVNYAPEKCGFCQGEAVDFWREGDYFAKCKVCQGMGTLLVAQPAQPCPFCQGKSAYFWRDGDYFYKCKGCKGSGWAYHLPSDEKSSG